MPQYLMILKNQSQVPVQPYIGANPTAVPIQPGDSQEVLATDTDWMALVPPGVTPPGDAAPPEVFPAVSISGGVISSGLYLVEFDCSPQGELDLLSVGDVLRLWNVASDDADLTTALGGTALIINSKPAAGKITAFLTGATEMGADVLLSITANANAVTPSTAVVAADAEGDSE